MTVKVSETFMFCLTSSLEYIKTIRLYLNRYFRIRPGMSSNFIFKIFPKVYHTFGHTRTSIYRPTDKWRPLEEPQGFFNKLVRTDLIQEKLQIESELKLKMYRGGPQRRRKLFLTATLWELSVNFKVWFCGVI